VFEIPTLLLIPLLVYFKYTHSTKVDRVKSQLIKYLAVVATQFLFIVTASCANTYRVYDTAQAQFVANDKAFDQIAKADIVILGETHYTKVVQQSEGWALEQLSLRNPSYQMAWEFLNYNDQAGLQSSFDDFVADKISGKDWIAKWFPNNATMTEVYLPMYESAKKYSQKVIGTNSPRALKDRLMSSGRSILQTDAQVWPFSYTIKNPRKEYFERFKVAMGGHVDEHTIGKYFLAQYYTDAYMANALNLKLVDGPIMMVVGNFHSDFGHGLPSYLKDLGVSDLLNVRIIDGIGLGEGELADLLKNDPKYGARGDYLLVIQ